MSISTVIPIPKGRHANITISSNYRCISLCSIYAKVYDLVFINKFYDHLVTSDLQFAFKRNHSTAMCTMVLKETLAYYSADGCTALSTFLDATKAFDRVSYSKLFRLLLHRNIPSLHLRFLLNMYTNSGAHVRWNGVLSKSFAVLNGVKQGGIVSPVLFCIYIYIY